MKKNVLLTLAALLLCALADAGVEGLLFFAAAWLAAFPRFAPFRWYHIVIGALISSATVIVLGESTIVFWGLLLLGAATLSLYDMRRAVLFILGAWLILRLDISPTIYVPLFMGIIWNGILVFTYKENYAIIKIYHDRRD